METDIENILTSYSLKRTKVRKDVLSLFFHFNYALSQSDIIKELKYAYDEATIYRTINIFESKNLIHKIPDNLKKSSYAVNKELKTGKCSGDIHIHFHCDNCGHNFCISPEADIKVKMPDNLLVNFVNIIANGLCSKCNGKNIQEN